MKIHFCVFLFCVWWSVGDFTSDCPEVPNYFHYKSKSQYTCPAFSTDGRKIDVRPFQVSQPKRVSPTYIIPLSVKLFRKVGLALLPDCYVCVGGTHLQEPITAHDLKSQALTLVRIFTWFFSCIDADRVHASDNFNDKAKIANCGIKCELQMRIAKSAAGV